MWRLYNSELIIFALTILIFNFPWSFHPIMISFKEIGLNNRILVIQLYIERSSSLSELTSVISYMELTHLGSEASIRGFISFGFIFYNYGENCLSSAGLIKLCYLNTCFINNSSEFSPNGCVVLTELYE